MKSTIESLRSTKKQPAKRSKFMNKCLQIDMYEQVFQANLGGDNSEIESQRKSLLGTLMTLLHALVLLAYGL